jgi:hypothetical protein
LGEGKKSKASLTTFPCASVHACRKDKKADAILHVTCLEKESIDHKPNIKN